VLAAAGADFKHHPGIGERPLQDRQDRVAVAFAGAGIEAFGFVLVHGVEGRQPPRTGQGKSRLSKALSLPEAVC